MPSSQPWKTARVTSVRSPLATGPEDAGPATKKVHVEIPRERITAKLEEQFNELRQQAAIPGFRVGHAPKKLIEKRFSQDIKDQVRRQLISESYEQAVEKNNLQVIGEPVFDNPDAIQLPEGDAAGAHRGEKRDEGVLACAAQVAQRQQRGKPETVLHAERGASTRSA